VLFRECFGLTFVDQRVFVLFQSLGIFPGDVLPWIERAEPRVWGLRVF